MRARSVFSRALIFPLRPPPLAFDFLLPDIAFGRNTGLGNLALLRDALGLNGFTRRNLCLFGLGFTLGTFAGQFGTLLGTTEFNITFLRQPGFFTFALNIQRLLFSFQIARANADHRILLDVIAQLALGFDVLDQTGSNHPRQTGLTG